MRVRLDLSSEGHEKLPSSHFLPGGSGSFRASNLFYPSLRQPTIDGMVTSARSCPMSPTTTSSTTFPKKLGSFADRRSELCVRLNDTTFAQYDLSCDKRWSAHRRTAFRHQASSSSHHHHHHPHHLFSRPRSVFPPYTSGDLASFVCLTRPHGPNGYL